MKLWVIPIAIEAMFVWFLLEFLSQLVAALAALVDHHSWVAGVNGFSVNGPEIMGRKRPNPAEADFSNCISAPPVNS